MPMPQQTLLMPRSGDVGVTLLQDPVEATDASSPGPRAHVPGFDPGLHMGANALRGGDITNSIEAERQVTTVLQFGKLQEDTFSMDIMAPMSPFQAFAIALCVFEA